MPTDLNKMFAQELNTETKCCKLCKHSYLRDDADYGYCKLQDNSFGSMHPKIITDLHVCDKWEKKQIY